ncbi:MAG: tetratricopeptide repeat protein [Thiomargarita sp.]|nr:tetratricopeptide repeat protein [Thiomargarita sp.]
MTEKDLFEIVIIVIVSLIMAIIIIPLWCANKIKFQALFKLSGELFEFFNNPITSLKDILRLVAQYILSETFNKTVSYYFEEAESVGYKEILIFLLGISCLIIFQAISISNMEIFLELLVPFLIYAVASINRLMTYVIRFKKTIAILLGISFLIIALKISAATIVIIAFVLLFFLKIFVIKRTQSFLKRAKELEFAALKLYKEKKLDESFIEYHNALTLYKSPILLKSNKFDINRAKVLKNIAFVLYQNDRLDGALLYCDNALEIYEELEVVENSAFMKEQVNLLKMSATILSKLEKREEAFERYKLIYELTGISAKPKDFCNYSGQP